MEESTETLATERPALVSRNIPSFQFCACVCVCVDNAFVCLFCVPLTGNVSRMSHLNKQDETQYWHTHSHTQTMPILWGIFYSNTVLPSTKLTWQSNNLLIGLVHKYCGIGAQWLLSIIGNKYAPIKYQCCCHPFRLNLVVDFISTQESRLSWRLQRNCSNSNLLILLGFSWFVVC